MTLPVRSPPKELTTSLPQPATLLPSINPMSPSQQETNNAAPTTPKMGEPTPQKERDSSPLSSPPSTSPKQPSPVSATAPSQNPTASVVQSEPRPAPTTPSSSPPQKQKSQVLQHDPTTPTSNTNAGDAEKRSPKRTREEDESSSSAFGTPPPKRTITKASATTNGKTTGKKAASPKKPVRKKAAPKSAAAASTPVRSQPSRSRKPPERFEDVKEKAPPQAAPARKVQSKVFDPVFITTNSGSRLVKADIYHMLLEGAAWTCLSAEQQSTLISMLPQDAANKTLLARVNAGETEGTRPSAFTLANDCFRTDVAKFKEDLMNGHLAKTWQAAAEQAVIERAAGEYDQWKAEEAESWWGQKSA